MRKSLSMVLALTVSPRALGEAIGLRQTANKCRKCWCRCCSLARQRVRHRAGLLDRRVMLACGGYIMNRDARTAKVRASAAEVQRR